MARLYPSRGRVHRSERYWDLQSSCCAEWGRCNFPRRSLSPPQGADDYIDIWVYVTLLSNSYFEYGAIHRRCIVTREDLMTSEMGYYFTSLELVELPESGHCWFCLLCYRDWHLLWERKVRRGMEGSMWNSNGLNDRKMQDRALETELGQKKHYQPRDNLGFFFFQLTHFILVSQWQGHFHSKAIQTPYPSTN